MRAVLRAVRGADRQDTPPTVEMTREPPERLGLEYLRITNFGVSQDVVQSIVQPNPDVNLLPDPTMP